MINRIFISVIMLSIVGGFVSSIFLVFQKRIYKYTSARFITLLNFAVLICFVIPFFKILTVMDKSAFVFSNGSVLVTVQQGTTTNILYSILKNTDIADFIVKGWAIGVIIYVMFEICYYLFFIFNIRRTVLPVEDDSLLQMFNQLCKDNHIVRNIDLVTCANINQVCVTGINKSFVIIPIYLIENLELDEIEIILQHELIHVKKRDVPLKIFIMILNGLNWFNPFFYLLKENLFEWTEIGCDEEATIFLSTQQKKAYIDVLLKLNNEEGRVQQRSVFCFNNKDKRFLKRRILNIMKRKNVGNQVSKIAVSAFMIALISGGSVIAKAADVPINSIFAEHIDVVNENELVPISAEEIEDYSDIADISEVKLSENTVTTRHQHKFVAVKLKDHKKNKDGSCKMTIYEAQHCTVCDVYVKGDVYSETTYKKCNHR